MPITFRILATTLPLLAAISSVSSTVTTPTSSLDSNGSSSSSSSSRGPATNLIGSRISQEISQRVTQGITDHIQEKLVHRNDNHDARQLQTEEFDRFVDIVSLAVISLPEFETSQTILFANLNILAENVKCFDINLRDVQINYNQESNQRLSLRLDVNDLDITCTLDYKWDYSFFNGNGVATIKLDDNYVSSTLAFASQDFDLYPPTNSSVEECIADITVSDMTFTGSVTDSIINVFESLLRGFVEDAVSGIICEEVGALGTTLIQDLIDQVDAFLSPYLLPQNETETNATAAELAMIIPPQVRLMNFQEEDGNEQIWFYGALKEVDAALGVWLIDPSGPREGGKDLGVNILLRDQVLDENRAFVLDVADLPFDFDPVLFEGHDELTQTTMTLETVRVFGLDTFNEFKPFINQGKYTLRNDLGWDFLSFELDVSFDMKPSTLPDSIITGGTDMHIVEKVTLKFGVEDINATLSVLLAIDQDRFGALKAGALLNEANILPCFMSSVFRSEITVLEALIGKIQEPALEGFIDEGIDNIITNAVTAAFTMYESVVIRAMPNIFNIAVKDIINESLLLSYDEPCPEPPQIEGFIDFRDLFLSPEASRELGGSGTEPYGNLASALFGFLKTQIATKEGDGTLSANSMFIRPLTSEQSGVEGMLALPGNLFSLAGDDINVEALDTLLKNFELKLSNVRVMNLDTMVPPFEFLKPTIDTYAFDNEIHLGPVPGRPLNISAELSVVFDEDSPLAMNNQIKVGMTSSAFEILAEITARLETMAIMNFPIKDLLEVQCWLATMPVPALNELGFRIDPEEERGLILTEFANKWTDLSVEVECISCTSKGLNMLPTLLDLLKTTNVTTVLASRVKFVVDDLVASDSFQTFLDRMLEGAGMSCPHHAAYVDEATDPDYAPLPFPDLSPTSIDTILFTLGTTVQVGFVVFTQMYADTEANVADPLSEQLAFDIPEGSNLINFNDFDMELPDVLQSGWDSVLSMISGSAFDANGQEELNVNSLMRNLFGSGSLELDLEGLSFGPDELQVELHKLRLDGMDTFKRFDVGVPVANQTFANDVELSTLAFELDFSLRSGDDSRRTQLEFQFDDVFASIPLFAAVDFDLLKKIQIGSLLRTADLIPCLLSSVYGFSFPSMVVSVGKIHMPAMRGMMPDTSASLASLVETLFKQYGTAMQESLPSVMNNGVRPLVNSFINYFVTGSGQGCPNSLLDLASVGTGLMQVAGPPFVDFRDFLLLEDKSKELGGRGDSRYGDLLTYVWGLIEGEFLTVDSNGNSPINSDVIGAFADDGELFFPGELFSTDFELSLGSIPTGITLRASNARVQNLDTVGNPFSLLDPVINQPSVLNNTATIGVERPLRAHVNLFVDINSKGPAITNDFDISVDLHSATLVLTALLKISEFRFAAFPLGDLFNLDCWMATLPSPALDAYGVRKDGVAPSAALEELLVSMQKLALNITCNECTSPGLRDLAELWTTPAATAEITSTANDVLEFLGGVLGGGLVQNQIDRRLNDAARRCPHSPEYQKDFTSFTYENFEVEGDNGDVSLAILVMVVCASLVAMLGVLVFIIRFITWRRHRRWLKTLPSSQLILLKDRQERCEEKEAELNNTSRSMFTSTEIPVWVRFSIPVIILGNIGLFLSGHLSLAAEVKIVVSFAGQVLTIEQFYQFSMATSTIEIWQAGGKELAILILIFSGIWPYTKQLITLVLWFLPPARCSISRRGSFLLWLDTLAKWSIVDIFTLIMSVAAFRVSISSPDIGFLPDDLYSLDLLVVPMWGLYANLIAQLISQVSSHFIIYYHRKIVAGATKEFRQKHGLIAASTHHLALTESSDISYDSLADCQYGPRKDLLNQQSFARPHRGESVKLTPRSFVNGLVIFITLIFVVLLLAGCILPSSGLEFQGILGIAVESGQKWQDAVTELSLFGLANLLMDQARFTDESKEYVGLGLLCALLVVTVLFVPLAQTASLVYQWFVPLAGRERKKMSVVTEVLQAWQYAEVYVISIIVATWQLGPISVFMINSYCYDLQETFDVMAYFGVISNDDAQCFKVDASIEAGAYILAGATVVLSLLNTLVMNASKQYFRDRDETISREEYKAREFGHTQTMESSMVTTPIHKAINDDSEEEEGEQMPDNLTRTNVEKYIKPCPVLFTDKFRWLLRASNEVASTTGNLAGADELAAASLAGAQPVEEKTTVVDDIGQTKEHEQPSTAKPCNILSEVDL